MPELLTNQQELTPAAFTADALKFGNFTLKCGRISIFFLNVGLLCTGPILSSIAIGYASTVVQHFSGQFDIIFGRAYKGIPLARATALLLHQQHQISVGYGYDRKEVKDHGEGGRMNGSPVKGKRVLILDDVMTAVTSGRNAVDLIQQEGGNVVGFVMLLDREEVGPTGESIISEMEERIGRTGSLKSILT